MVTQRYGVNANLLFTWRRRNTRSAARGGAEPFELLPVREPGRKGHPPLRSRRRRGWLSAAWRSCSPPATGSCRGGRRRGGVGACGQGAVAAMIPIPAGVRVWLSATGRTDMAQGVFRWACADRPRDAEAQSAFWASVRLSRAARRSDQMPVARRPGLLSVGQTSGARPVSMAIYG